MIPASPAPLERDVASGASDPMAISLAPFERQFLDFGEAIRTGQQAGLFGRRWISRAAGGSLDLRILPEGNRGEARSLAPFRMQVRVPASSANLGPGFDALGLALGIYLTCRFERAERLSIRVAAAMPTRFPTGEDNLIWQTALAVAARRGRDAAAHRSRDR